MDGLLDTTVIFTFMLALALLIERILELLKTIYDFVDCRMHFEKIWSSNAKKLSLVIEENLKALQMSRFDAIDKLLKQYAHKYIKSDGVVTISGDLFRATTVRFAAKVIAITLGVVYAFAFDLDIVEIWQHAAGRSADSSQHLLPTWARTVVTGIALGLGSGPLHKIITTIERQRKKQEQKHAGA